MQWVRGRYIKGRDWWEYTPKEDSNWYWKKLSKVKERLRYYPKEDYMVKEVYTWLLNSPTNPPWTKTLWTRTSLPRHTFIAWLLMHQRLPILQRVGRFTQLTSMSVGCVSIVFKHRSTYSLHAFRRKKYGGEPSWTGLLIYK